jgi:transposase
MIEMEILPFIPKTKRGFAPTVGVAEIVNAILYKLKTGVQWNRLPVKALFSDVCLSWQSVYHHCRKWCLSGTWKDCWIKLMNRHKSEFDLSSVNLDGSHTPAIRGVQSVEYQGKKKRKTILYI